MAKFSDYKERKIERFRQGQATCSVETLLSDPEIRIALVPLTEGEYLNALEAADSVLAGENPAGYAVRDEAQRKMVMFYACREEGNLEEKFFDDVSEVFELDAADINHLYDCYLEMVDMSSPSLMGLSEEDFLVLKEVLPKIVWNELSGKQWYAAQRFLNSIRPNLLTAKSSG